MKINKLNLSVVNDENNKENNENNETESTNKLTIDVKAQVGKDILKENDIVYQGEAISFSVKLKNETEEVINNIKGIYQLPDGLVYATRNERFSNENLEGTISGNKTNRLWNINKDISQCEINRDFLAPGEVYEVVYDILVEEMTEETTIENIFEFFVEEQKVNEQKMSFIYKSAKIRVDAFNPVDLNNGSGYYYNYYLEVNNLTNETLRDVTVKIFIGKELEYLAVTGYFDENDYDNETGTVTVKYNEMEANKITSIKLLVEANKFEDYKYDYDVELYALSYMNEETYRSNLVVKEVEVAKISIIQTSEQEGLTLKYGDEIEYNFVVKNEGKIPALIKITDDLPEGLIPVSAEYEYYDWNEDKKEYEKRIENLDISQQVEAEGEQQEDFKIDIIIPEQKTMQIKIKCEVDLLYEDKDVINVATIVGEDVFTRTSNGIKNKLLHYNFEEIEDPEQPENPDNPDNPNKPDYPEEPDNPNNPDNPEEPDNPNNPDNPDNPDNPYNPDTPDKPDKPNVENKYNISGVIWIDENKNGQREEREELLSGIIVKLFDIETGAIVVDKDNNIKKVTTDKNGYYEFKDIKEGKYIVLFQYDTDKYDITTYQQKSVSETKNSDAIEKEVNIDGKILNVGVTDTIILNKNYDNIDMGLTVEHKFDLKLDKYVSEVIVKNSKEEKIYEFNNSKLAKVEIPAKQINSTEIDIKYKIVVTNEGNVSGFAKEIIDYIPEGLEYNALINNIKWDKTNNGSIVTKELADKRIEPGESREVTLVLTVKGKVARIINSAEIGNTDNVYKLKDIDSTENNKNKAEDDYSEAEFIVSVKTGVVINVIRIIGILIVLIVLVYLCISKKINKKMLVFVLFSTIICTIGTSTKAEVVLTTVSSGSYRGQPDYVIITVHDVGYIAIWAGNNPCWKYMNLAYGHDATAQNSRGSYLKDLYTCTSISDHETCGDYKSDNPTNHLYRLNQSASKIYYDFKSLVNGLGGGQYWQQKYNSSGYYPEDPDYDNRPLAIKMGFKEKDFEIPGTTVSTSKNEIDINTHEYVEDKVFIGPFYFTSSSSNSEYELDNYNTLVVRDNNGKTINYEIYDGNNYSSNKITNKQISNLQGKNFYLLVDDVLKGIQVTANIQYTISKSVSKVYALHYDACGKSDPKFKDDTIREYYDLCAECNNETSHPQSYTKAKVESRYETKTVSKQLKWVVDMPKGKIEVTKKDTDSNQMISGATIRLDGINVEYSKTVTMTSGTYLFENLRPVPELSFAVRELKCTAGIMITASHNPPKYNGYKVYWDDGSQIIDPRDKDIISKVRDVKEYSEIKEISKEEAIEKGLFNVVGTEMDDKYINTLKSLILNPEIVREQGKSLKVVYTPLHGTGNTIVERLLKEIGIENVYVVPEQKYPDGNFPTVDYPNPEDKRSFELALELAKKVDADVVLATDPDADRLGIFAKDNKTDEYINYTGNMSALLIAEYRISQMYNKGILPEKGMMITTVVSSKLTRAIAKEYNLKLYEVLTGFKNIGAVVKKEEEQENGYKYVFGFEESYGCLIGDYARDKDGISAVMALCEAACYYKSKNQTLWDQMNSIYEKYGYYKEDQVSIVLEGSKGAEKIKEMMTNMRNTPVERIGNYKVLGFMDIDRDYVKNMVTGEEAITGLPKSNVLCYDLEDNSWCAVRPSGTEPKIKLYMGVRGTSENDANIKLEKLKDAMVSSVK